MKHLNETGTITLENNANYQIGDYYPDNYYPVYPQYIYPQIVSYPIHDNQLKNWIEGFLKGKKNLNEKEVQMIREKINEL